MAFQQFKANPGLMCVNHKKYPSEVGYLIKSGILGVRNPNASLADVPTALCIDGQEHPIVRINIARSSVCDAGEALGSDVKLSEWIAHLHMLLESEPDMQLGPPTVVQGEEICPLCLEQMPPLTFRGLERSRLMCCGVAICGSCLPVMRRHEVSSGHECLLCDGSLPTSIEIGARLTVQHAEKGEAWAQFNLGTRYLDGHGVPKDKVKARYWLQQAAEQDHVIAQGNLGTILLMAGANDEAAIWLQRAADNRDPVGISGLARLYSPHISHEQEVASSIKQSAKHAVQLWQLAADSGWKEAQRELGFCYDCGLGVPRDEVKGECWLTQAAAQGDAQAQHQLGGMCLRMARLAAAYFWIAKAAEKREDARDLLSQMKDSINARCGSCGKKLAASSSLCPQCKAVRYCNKECQKQHWKSGHKKDCEDTAEAARAIEAGGAKIEADASLMKACNNPTVGDVEQAFSKNHALTLSNVRSRVHARRAREARAVSSEGAAAEDGLPPSDSTEGAQAASDWMVPSQWGKGGPSRASKKKKKGKGKGKKPAEVEASFESLKYQEKDCKICFDELQEGHAVLLKCGHAFCGECVEEWTQTKYELKQPTACPSCRTVYAKKEIRKITH